MSWTIRCRTTSRAPRWTNEIPSMCRRISWTTTRPDRCPAGRSIWVTSPFTTAFEPKPRRVRNIFICSGEVFWASSRMMNESFRVLPRMNARGATSMVPRSINRPKASGSIISYRASYRGRRYGSIFSYSVPGRKPSFSPASTAGRVRMIRDTSRAWSARTASVSTSVGRTPSSLIMSMVRPTDEGVSCCPRSRSVTISSNSWATRSASTGSPVIVISFPRTRMWESNAVSTSLRNSSRSPRRATIDWWPGTRILTWVASAKGFLRASLLLETGSPIATPTSRLYGSSGWPPHLPAAQKMEVEVMDALSGVRPYVGDDSPAGSIDLVGPGQVSRGDEHVGQHVALLVAERPGRLDVLLRDDQDVHRSLRIDVPEGHHVIGGVHDIRLLITRGDPAEQAVLHGPLLSLRHRDASARR